MNPECYWWIAGFMTGWFFGMFLFGFVNAHFKGKAQEK
jgi:hypothetical protein